MKKLLILATLAIAFTALSAQTPCLVPYPTVLTNDSLTITSAEGFHGVTIFVVPSSTASGIIRPVATGTIGGKAVTSQSLPASTSFTYPLSDKWIDKVKVVAPSGCTILVTGYKYAAK